MYSTLSEIPPAQPATKLTDLFISCHESDREWVETELLTPLRSAELTVRCDWEFAGGTNVIAGREEAITGSRHVLLILTRAWCDDHMTKSDELLARAIDPDASSRKLLPLVLEECTIPSHLSRLARFDFTRVDLRPASLVKLLKDLGKSPEVAMEVTSRHAQHGLAALVVLMRSGPVRAAVQSVREAFIVASTEIQVLGRCKRMHEYLHRTEVQFSHFLEKKQLLLKQLPSADCADDLGGEFDDLWTKLEAFVNQNLAPEVRTLIAYATGDAFPPDQVPWVNGVKDALEGLERACQERNAKSLKRPTERLLQVLGEEPNKFNTRLVTAAERLPLDRVVKALERISEEASKSEFDAAAEVRLREFRQGVPALGDMHKHLHGLVANHNVLQYVSCTLRPLSNAEVDVEDVAALKSELQEALRRLHMNAASDWALQFFKAWENLSQALLTLTAEPQLMRKVRSYFFSFCGSVNTGFNQVDIDLFKFCERLQRVSSNLDRAIEEIQND